MNLKIDFKSITSETTSLTYKIGDDFFEFVSAQDIHGGNLCCDIEVKKTTGVFEVLFDIKGDVRVACDRCLADMVLAVESSDKMIVKFGEEYQEDDDLVVITEEESEVDFSWYIYESIALSIPTFHAHDPEECDVEMMRLLGEHRASQSAKDTQETTMDPRWNKLADLLVKD